MSTCAVAGCTRDHRARGMCATHYGAERRAGRLTPRPTTSERFWQKVNKRSADECWEWTAARNKDGYGEFSVGGRGDGRMVGAHRFAYASAVGPIPKGLHIRHLCGNPPCCNPSHLAPGTASQNMRDMAVHERTNTTKLTAAQVVEIRAEHRAGASQRTLAERFGVTPSNIAFIVSGATWQHVPMPS